jgi:hypothetical protein
VKGSIPDDRVTDINARHNPARCIELDHASQICRKVGVFPRAKPAHSKDLIEWTRGTNRGCAEELGDFGKANEARSSLAEDSEFAKALSGFDTELSLEDFPAGHRSGGLVSRKQIAFRLERQVGSEIVSESASEARLSSVAGSGDDTVTAWVGTVAGDLARPLEREDRELGAYLEPGHISLGQCRTAYEKQNEHASGGSEWINLSHWKCSW